MRCSWCKDKPVLNARAWVAPGGPKYAPCPRCGREFTEAEGDAARAGELDKDVVVSKAPRS